jgi:hypothetical protein
LLPGTKYGTERKDKGTRREGKGKRKPAKGPKLTQDFLTIKIHIHNETACLLRQSYGYNFPFCLKESQDYFYLYFVNYSPCRKKNQI